MNGSHKKFIIIWILFVLVAISYHQFDEDFFYASSIGMEAQEIKEPAVNETSALNNMIVNECTRLILPKRIYSVFGLESSGTTFITDVLRQALGLREYRDGHAPVEDPNSFLSSDVQVQHISFPWGSWCTDPALKGAEVPIVNVILPLQCTKGTQNTSEIECCDSLVEDALGYNPNGKPVRYPRRYSLDIIQNKEWYDTHGVDQWSIIVLRDVDISVASRYKNGHCKVKELLRAEEKAGKAIIRDAINKYILNKDERMVTPESFEFWKASNDNKLRRRLSKEDDEMNPAAFPIVLTRNKVVVVSYESMVFLGDQYFEILFDTLGIETDFKPQIRNANHKYVNVSF